MAQADGSVILDTKMNNDALEKGFEQLKTDCESLGIACEKAGDKIKASFADYDVSTNIQNAVAKLEQAQVKLQTATDYFNDAVAMGDDKSAEAWANKRVAAYEKVENAQRRLTQVIASEAEKQARAEEKAAKQAAKVVEQEANTKESAISSMFDSAGESASKFSSRLKRIAAGAFVFNIIRSGLRSVTQYFGNALMANTQFSTALNRLKGSLMVAFQPIYEAVLGEVALSDLSQTQLVDALTNNGVSEGLYLLDDQLYINASYIVSGKLNASLITAGVLQSKDGETFKLDLDNGTFSMSGTGKFLSPDKKSYITVDGGAFVLYAEDKYGSFVPIAQIGFSEDSEGVDYPYILLGNAGSSGDGNLSLIKAFGNGIYVGNSAPKLNTGNFVGLKGAAGFFVDVVESRVYNVKGETLQDSFTAVFG